MFQVMINGKILFLDVTSNGVGASPAPRVMLK